MQQLYQNIRARRRQLGMTQQELAQRTGYTSTTSISKIESGKVDLPQSKIPVFAKALQTTPEELLGLLPVYRQSAAQHISGRQPDDFAGYLQKETGLLIPADGASVQDVKRAQPGIEYEPHLALAELLPQEGLPLRGYAKKIAVRPGVAPTIAAAASSNKFAAGYIHYA